jgi:hypothetical protein
MLIDTLLITRPKPYKTANQDVKPHDQQYMEVPDTFCRVHPCC